MKNKTNSKNSTVASALLLASSPAWAGKNGQPPDSGNAGQTPLPNSNHFVGKSNPLRIASITLDQASEKKVQTCKVPKVKLNQPRPNSILSLAFDPKKNQVVTLQFEMSKIPATKDERVLLLLYSRCLSKKPQIKTLFSRNKLALDIDDIQVLGIHEVPAIQAVAQPPTRVGVATSPATQEMTLEVNLETDKLAQQINAGNDTFYFQGALLKKTDFEKENYSLVNLSQLEAIHVTPKACPNKEQFSRDINSVNEACKHLPTKTE
jgi:hypothetical protein